MRGAAEEVGGAVGGEGRSTIMAPDEVPSSSSFEPSRVSSLKYQIKIKETREDDN